VTTKAPCGTTQAPCGTTQAPYMMTEVARPYAMTKSARLDSIWMTVRSETTSAVTKTPAADF
jgi:hypothetical protein